MTEWHDLRARDLMTSPVRVIERELSAQEALRILSEERVTGAPVVDGRGAPVGVVTLVDIVDFVAGLEREGPVGTFYGRGSLRWDRESGSFANFDFDEDPLRSALVDEVMSPNLITVTPEAGFDEVVRVMADEEVHRVLVVEEGNLKGIVSTSDVIKALAGRLSPR